MHRTLIVIVLFMAVAGCTSAPRDLTPAPGSIQPGNGTFHLTLLVTDATDNGGPVEGAFVTAGNATGNLTQATTGTDGIASLTLASPQIVALNVSARGRIAAFSYPLRLGAGAGQSSGAREGPCGAVLDCTLDRSMSFSSENAHIRMRLLPAALVRDVSIHVPASAAPPGQPSPFVTVPFTFVNTSDTGDLFSTLAAHVDASLSWTNAPGAEGDLDVGVTCSGRTFASQQGSGATLATIGVRTAKVSADLPTGCNGGSVMAFVRSATTDMDARAALSFTFRPGAQRPISG